MRRIAVIAGLVIAMLAVPARAQAIAPAPIGPKQFFTGAVNVFLPAASPGATSAAPTTGAAAPAAIRVGCFGPIRPGQTGHPLAGQSVVVIRQPVPISVASAAALGFTGEADSIAAYLTFASPSASPVVPLIAVLDAYFLPAPIPTTLIVPCGGTGTVRFAPVDGGSAARPATVAVRFESQP